MPKVQKNLKFTAKELAEKLGLKDGEVTSCHINQKQDRNGNYENTDGIEITAWIEE